MSFRGEQQFSELGSRFVPLQKGGVMQYCKSNSTKITVIVLIIVLLVIFYIVYKARQTTVGMKGPYSDCIGRITNVDQREDAKEWQYMYQISRRPEVKEGLKKVLDEYASSTKAQAVDHGDHSVMGMDVQEANASGMFTPI
jgi:hypothetical protein